MIGVTFQRDRFANGRKLRAENILFLPPEWSAQESFELCNEKEPDHCFINRDSGGGGVRVCPMAWKMLQVYSKPFSLLLKQPVQPFSSPRPQP